MKILLVDDDQALITTLTRSLSAQHYIVDAVQDGEQGWLYGSTFEYDLVILDILLPKVDGLSLCQRFRAEGYAFPILLLTAQNSSTAKVQGLDAGADDYVVKPFDAAELIARIRALVRRGSTNPMPLLTWGEMQLNPGTCEVTYSGQLLNLTTKEYDLLELLLRQSHHVFSIDEILDRLWSSESFPAESTVRSHLRRLRHKLVEAGAPSDFISTLHGRGYYLKLPTPVASPQKDSSTDQTDNQAQYLAFLNETWLTTKPRCLEQLDSLAQIAKAPADAARRSQAQFLAHKLAGTLGAFGLLPEMQSARYLEDFFSRSNLNSSLESNWNLDWNLDLYSDLHSNWNSDLIPEHKLEQVEQIEQIAALVTQLQQAVMQIQTIQPATSNPKLPEPDLPETNVMIVDDDQVWLQSLPQLLRPWGFKATTLAEPEQFWTVLQMVNPDLLILAINMPQMNGLELCQILRRDPRWQRLPILFLSALTDAATQNQAFTAGADDYLCKPIAGIDLANRMINRLQRIRAWAS